MSEVIIKIENLYKLYRLGVISHKVLYKDIQSWWARVRKKDDPNKPLFNRHFIAVEQNIEKSDNFWALQNVSFEVNKGDVIGIIGKNGAGKSTLLKILSRVTTPTKGTVKIKGRIASLLEVGTGFHPELTGRENIFLNGAILGMTKKEINSKFDEIVAFAELVKFIDTPVKRYSSGMYVRLAFAVAAHLEPEILIVDEVLAVGDAEFQKKCLGKMKDVAGQGRTVLFVSHNIDAVNRLCNKAVLLKHGNILTYDEVSIVTNQYLTSSSEEEGERIWNMNEQCPQIKNFLKIHTIRVTDSNGKIKTKFDVKESISLEIEYSVLQEYYRYNVHFYLTNDDGAKLFVTMDNLDTPFQNKNNPVGYYKERCVIPPELLNEGRIIVEALICTHPTSGNYITIPNAILFTITDDMSLKGVRGNWSRSWPKYLFRPRCEWNIVSKPIPTQ